MWVEAYWKRMVYSLVGAKQLPMAIFHRDRGMLSLVNGRKELSRGVSK